MASSGLAYRKEIDGLRAIAVLSVVFCHAGFVGFSGGFVGVDVFFVISGFLITRIISEDLKNGNFSLAIFYERRIRRIFPALFTVLFFSTCFAWLWLWPEDFRNYSRSLVYVTLFASNIHFFKEIGYFAPDVDLRPLLHTWSLGVEEQFYIFFPLILLFCHRFGRKLLLGVLFLLGLASLGAAEFGLKRFPDATFYLLPTRAWELLVGAICALVAGRSEKQAMGIWARNLGSLVGALMIALAVFSFDEETPFPGLSALLPVLGAALIIMAATPETWLSKLLTVKPVQSIGLWSYSIYLWHQPVFAFARYRVEDPGWTVFVPLTLGVLLLSYLSWRFVETPFRKIQVERKLLWSLAGGAILVVLMIGLIGKHRSDYFKRFSPGYEEQLKVDEMLRRNYGLDRNCDEVGAVAACRTDSAPEVLVWGDSFAMHLVNGILASRPDIRMVQWTKSGCGPFLNISPVFDGNLAGANECMAFNDQVIEFVRKTPSIRQVVVASLFSQYLGEGALLLQRSGDVRSMTEDELSASFRETITQLRSLGVVPVIIAPPPANGNNLGRCLARSMLIGRDLDYCNFSIEENSASRVQTYRFLGELSEDYPVIWLHELMCQSGQCRTHEEGVFLFLDEGHLSRLGSAHVGEKYNIFNLIEKQSRLSEQ